MEIFFYFLDRSERWAWIKQLTDKQLTKLFSFLHVHSCCMLTCVVLTWLQETEDVNPNRPEASLSNLKLRVWFLSESNALIVPTTVPLREFSSILGRSSVNGSWPSTDDTCMVVGASLTSNTSIIKVFRTCGKRQRRIVCTCAVGEKYEQFWQELYLDACRFDFSRNWWTYSFG